MDRSELELEIFTLLLKFEKENSEFVDSIDIVRTDITTFGGTGRCFRRHVEVSVLLPLGSQ